MAGKLIIPNENRSLTITTHVGIPVKLHGNGEMTADTWCGKYQQGDKVIFIPTESDCKDCVAMLAMEINVAAKKLFPKPEQKEPEVPVVEEPAPVTECSAIAQEK